MPRLFAPKKSADDTPKVAGPPTPEPVTKDDLKTLLEGALGGVAGQLAASIGEMKAGIEQLASRPVQPQVYFQPGQPAGPQGVSDEQIDQAVLTGQGAAQHIRALIDREVNAAADRLIQQRIAPLETFGVNTLGEISKKVAMQGGTMPHYNRYRKEIDEKLSQLAPELRANPAAIDMVYKSVLGEHTDELVKEAAEEAIRKAQEPVPVGRGTTPGTGSGTPRDGEDDIPSIADVGGTPGMEALQHKGDGKADQDSFARSLGYDSWSAYIKQYNTLLKEVG